MRGGKFLVQQKIQQQLSIPPVVLLPALSKLPDGQRVAHKRLVPDFLYQSVKPQGVARRLHAHDGSWRELRVELA